MVDANLVIYEKYHFRCQAPRALGNGLATKLARYEQNEGKLAQRDKYKDLYFAEYNRSVGDNLEHITLLYLFR